MSVDEVNNFIDIIIGQYARLCQGKEKPLPFTFWTDLGYKKLPSVTLTEGSMLTDHNCSINWNLTLHQTEIGRLFLIFCL